MTIIKKVETEVFDMIEKVYNFDIGNCRTFYITEQGVLVGNTQSVTLGKNIVKKGLLHRMMQHKPKDIPI